MDLLVMIDFPSFSAPKVVARAHYQQDPSSDEPPDVVIPAVVKCALSADALSICFCELLICYRPVSVFIDLLLLLFYFVFFAFAFAALARLQVRARGWRTVSRWFGAGCVERTTDQGASGKRTRRRCAWRCEVRCGLIVS